MAGQPRRNAVSLLDRTLGDGLERQVVAHHERRLRDLGWERAFSPGPGLWAEADPPPRPGNSAGTADRRRGRAAAHGRGADGGPLAGQHRRLGDHSRLRPHALGTASRAARRSRRAGGAHAGARAAVGGGAAAGVPAVAPQRVGRAPQAHGRNEDPGGAGQPRAPDCTRITRSWSWWTARSPSSAAST